MENSLILLICVAGCLVAVTGYPSGQISASCDTMLPTHGINSLQSSAAPYNIKVSKTSFAAGDSITVTIQSTSGNGFKGFLLEARSVGGDRITGSFSTTDGNAQTLSCSAGAFSSVSPELLTIAQQLQQNLFSLNKWQRATIVSNYSSFWTGVQSDIIVALQMSNTTCGSLKYCLSSPENCSPSDSNCLFMSAAPSSNGYVFEMSGATSGYLAIGFSNGTKLGNSDIYICTNSSGNITVQQAYTTGEVIPIITNTSPAIAIVTSYINGVLKCSFITLPTQQRSSASSIFLVSGPAMPNGQIQQYTKIARSISFADISSVRSGSVQNVTSQNGTSQNGLSPVIRCHGALMLIAWLATSTVGIGMASIMRNIAGKEILGNAAWFQAHLILMVLSIILTIIAFIMVFVEVGGWRHNIGAHPVLGCIVMILTLIQPTVAFFRPAPDSSRRVRFNRIHKIFGIVIKILAGTNLFLGLKLVDTSPHLWMTKVMGGHTAWEVLFNVAVVINIVLQRKGKFQNNHKIKAETVIFLVFLAGNLPFLIALLVGIGSSDQILFSS